jgi:signal peptidase
MRPRVVAAAQLAVFLAIVVALVWALGRLWEPVRVGGLSMHPTLHVGDVAIVARDSPPIVGDVVLVRSPGHESVLHRVAGFTPAGALVTQGDANETPDREPAPPRDVVGRAVVIVPVGALVERWRERYGYATMAAQSNTQRR